MKSFVPLQQVHTLCAINIIDLILPLLMQYIPQHNARTTDPLRADHWDMHMDIYAHIETEVNICIAEYNKKMTQQT